MERRAFSAKHRLQTLKTVVRSQSAVFNLHCPKECIMGNPCAVHPLQNTVFSVCKESRVCRTSQKKQWTYLELYVTERRSVTSHYHGSKISGSQQLLLFLTDRTICIVEQWMKSMGYGFVPAAVMYRNVIHVIFFIICRTTFA